MNKMASLVMVTCNRKKITELALNSILEGTEYHPYQLIIIDNDSQDGTEEMVGRLAREEEGITALLCSKNLGKGKAANLGFKLAEGDYLIGLDDDLILPPGWLKKMVEALEKVPGVGWLSTNLTEESRSRTGGKIEYKDQYLQDFQGVTIETSPGVGGWCIAMPRSTYQLLGEYREDCYYGGIDQDYCVRAKEAGLLVGYVWDVKARHLSGSKEEWEEYPEYRSYKLKVHRERWSGVKDHAGQENFFDDTKRELFSKEEEEEFYLYEKHKIRNNQLLQDQTGQLYLFSNNKLFPCPRVYYSLRDQLKDKIFTLPEEIIQLIEKAPGKAPVRLGKAEHEKTIYFLFGNHKYPLASQKAFFDHGFNAGMISTIEPDELNSYQMAAQIH